MTTFTKGTKVFCDFHFGGKPKGKVVEVNIPGNGKDTFGIVKVKLTETVGAYKKGEIIEVSTYVAVPINMILPKLAGQYFVRVSTNYNFVLQIDLNLYSISCQSHITHKPKYTK